MDYERSLAVFLPYSPRISAVNARLLTAFFPAKLEINNQMFYLFICVLTIKNYMSFFIL